jgi:hypothetical protein
VGRHSSRWHSSGRQWWLGALAIGFASPGDAAPAPVRLARQRVPIRRDKVALELAVEDLQGKKVQVVTRSTGPTAIAQQKEVDVAPGASLRTEIPANGSTVLKFPAAAPAAPGELPEAPRELPGLLVDSVSNPQNTSSQIRLFTPALYAREVPLRWNPEHRDYETELAVGLLRKDESASLEPLATPVAIQLFGDGVEVDPALLQIVQPGTAGFRSARISLSRHEDTGKITALSDFGEQSYVVTASARFASLTLSPDQASIPGFGIGTAQLTLVRSAEDGRALSDARELPFLLSSSCGRFDRSDSTILPKSSRTNVELRSSWFGECEVTASADGVLAAPVKLRFTIPWSYLSSIGIGALMGTWARAIWKPERTRREIVGGFLVGVILALGAFVGIGYSGFIPAAALFTEIGCFIVAALAGYTGRPALDWIAGSHGKPTAG